jgi:mxaL protein
VKRGWNWRISGLAGAASLVLLALVFPSIELPHAVGTYLVIVDITRSMNTVDANLNGHTISRFAAVKAALHDVLSRLPCGSRIALGMFTERRSTLLFTPIEVCEHFGAIDAALQAIDWRMAWAADSSIAYGLYNAIGLAAELRSNLLFVTDGHEAPPENASYRPVFTDEPGQVGGFVIGVGGSVPTPMPKFNEQGEPSGFYTEAEIPQASRFGLPPEDARERAGYDPRNAPFGREAGHGQEHLSYLHEPHLRELAAITGLHYAPLRDGADLVEQMLTHGRSTTTLALTDISAWFAGAALLILIFTYGAAALSSYQHRGLV